MRVAICDDDANVRDHYAELIQLVAKKQGLSVTVDKMEASEQLLFALDDKKTAYDILFLDVFMPKANGIDLGLQIKKNNFLGSIIYLTRSTDHMLPAFDVGAANYIVKGHEYDSDRFERVFKKTVQEIERKKRKYLLLNGVTEHRNVAIDSIAFFEVRKHLCYVYYGKDEAFEFTSSLSRIEKTLVPFGFVRVHKSFLVNTAAVKSFTYKEITMQNDVLIPLGRKRSIAFRAAMEALSEFEGTSAK